MKKQNNNLIAKSQANCIKAAWQAWTLKDEGRNWVNFLFREINTIKNYVAAAADVKLVC